MIIRNLLVLVAALLCAPAIGSERPDDAGPLAQQRAIDQQVWKPFKQFNRTRFKENIAKGDRLALVADNPGLGHRQHCG